jgi:hypothetical protein
MKSSECSSRKLTVVGGIDNFCNIHGSCLSTTTIPFGTHVCAKKNFDTSKFSTGEVCQKKGASMREYKARSRARQMNTAVHIIEIPTTALACNEKAPIVISNVCCHERHPRLCYHLCLGQGEYRQIA